MHGCGPSFLPNVLPLPMTLLFVHALVGAIEAVDSFHDIGHLHEELPFLYPMHAAAPYLALDTCGQLVHRVFPQQLVLYALAQAAVALSQ
eukprot:8688853-Pyramimonas_sp.AAC.1